MQRALFGSATRNLDIKQLDVVKRCQAHINENGGGWIKCVRVSPSPWIFNNCRFFNRDSCKASKECTGSRPDWDARFMKVFAAEIFEMRLVRLFWQTISRASQQEVQCDYFCIFEN